MATLSLRVTVQGLFLHRLLVPTHLTGPTRVNVALPWAKYLLPLGPTTCSLLLKRPVRTSLRRKA